MARKIIFRLEEPSKLEGNDIYVIPSPDSNSHHDILLTIVSDRNYKTPDEKARLNRNQRILLPESLKEHRAYFEQLAKLNNAKIDWYSLFSTPQK